MRCKIAAVSAAAPANLLDATRAFEASDAAIELFGQAFVEHFAASRKWEVREYDVTSMIGS